MKTINYVISIYGNFDITGEDEDDCQDQANIKKEEIREVLERIEVYLGDIEIEEGIERDEEGHLKI